MNPYEWQTWHCFTNMTHVYMCNGFNLLPLLTPRNVQKTLFCWFVMGSYDIQYTRDYHPFWESHEISVTNSNLFMEQQRVLNTALFYVYGGYWQSMKNPFTSITWDTYWPVFHGMGWCHVRVEYIHTHTFWLLNIAMENGPFIDGLHIKNGDFIAGSSVDSLECQLIPSISPWFISSWFLCLNTIIVGSPLWHG